MITGTAVIATGVAVLPFLPSVFSTSLHYAFTGPAENHVPGLTPPLECTPGTPRQTEGPFYTPKTPNRADLRESGTTGETLVLEGMVLTPDCNPVAGAVIDIWHCDDKGRYDNSGYRYRGHQFTDRTGMFRFNTIRPPKYPGRTPHIHVKVQGEATRLLTTQLYFPDLAEVNNRDSIYRDELLMQLSKEDTYWRGRFDFVLPLA